jgi:hypothetical protein
MNGRKRFALLKIREIVSTRRRNERETAGNSSRYPVSSPGQPISSAAFSPARFIPFDGRRSQKVPFARADFPRATHREPITNTTRTGLPILRDRAVFSILTQAGAPCRHRDLKLEMGGRRSKTKLRAPLGGEHSRRYLTM